MDRMIITNVFGLLIIKALSDKLRDFFSFKAIRFERILSDNGHHYAYRNVMFVYEVQQTQ